MLYPPLGPPSTTDEMFGHFLITFLAILDNSKHFSHFQTKIKKSHPQSLLEIQITEITKEITTFLSFIFKQ